MLRDLLYPSKKKVLLTIPFAVLFWFLPIVSKSIFAVPFLNFSFSIISLALNLVIAYLFSCLIISKANKMLTVAVLIIIYLLIPKISGFVVGDIGGKSHTYCDCLGFKWRISRCCYSAVDYCIGICKRNESLKAWGYEQRNPKYCKTADDCVTSCGGKIGRGDCYNRAYVSEGNPPDATCCACENCQPCVKCECIENRCSAEIIEGNCC